LFNIGAFTWLATKRLQHPLTVFAAVIAILTLGTDTFIQQLIGNKDCTVNLSGNATIPRTNFFNPQISHIEAGPAYYPNTQEMTTLVSGLLSSPTDVGFDCVSGNCTYSTFYSTLGYCSTCADISHQLQFDFLSGNCTIDNCTIVSRLPSGLSVNSFSIASNGGFGTMNLMAMSGIESSNYEYEILVGRSYYTETNLDPNGEHNRSSCDNTAPNSSWLCRGYGAASCTLSACVRTYNATVTAGRLSETLIETSPPDVQWDHNDEAYNSIAAVIDTHCITTDEAHQLRAANYTWNSTTRYIVYNRTTWDPLGSDHEFGGWVPAPNSSFPQSMATHDCVYMLSPFFTAGLDMFFLNDSVFAGTLSATMEEGPVLAFFNGSQVLQKFWNNSYNSLESIDGLFQNAASGFTNHIRENGNANYSKLAKGDISHYAICVDVHWPWIVLPAVLSGCTIILLFLVIIETMTMDAPIWKGSPLVVIFQGPGGLAWLRKHRDSAFSNFGQESLLSKEAIEKTAKGIHVQLQDGEPNVRLAMVEHEQFNYVSPTVGGASSSGIEYQGRGL
jgi:hypothetical protein